MFSIFKKLAWFYRKHWKSYTIGVGALILSNILNGISPIIIEQVIDEMTFQTLTLESLAFYAGLLLLFGIVIYFLRYLWRHHIFGNSTKLEAEMRSRLFKHFTRMDQQFYDDYRTGDLMAHATNDLASLRFVAGGGTISLVDSVTITIITLFAMTVWIDWRLTLLTAFPLLLLIPVSRVLGRLINRHQRGALQAFSDMNEQVQESVAGMKVIKTFGEEEEDYESFTEETANVADKNQEVYKINSAYVPAIQVIMGLAYTLTLFFGSYFVQNDLLTIGSLIAYFTYLGQLQRPLVAAGRLVNTMERGNASYERLETMLAYTPTVQEAEDPVRSIQGQSLKVDIPQFTFAGDKSPTLQDIHLDMEGDRTLGIVGPTGSGKSTLFNLIVRNYDLKEGAILIDGINIKDIALEELHRKVGYVSQDNLLFSTTVRENIRFGRPDLTQDQVEYYAKVANIHEDILDFAEGYDTPVGERGVSLSGGQKQRISIARTLAMEPPILLLDDALSAVDSKTEQKILANLRDFRKEGLTLVATHRMSSIMHSDEIIVMKDGQIVDRGDHGDLLEAEGWYANMYMQQQLEEKIEGEDE